MIQTFMTRRGFLDLVFNVAIHDMMLTSLAVLVMVLVSMGRLGENFDFTC